MKYTIKQINRILNVQEFVAISNTLSKIYTDFENKELLIDTLTDRDRIYRLYCASIYNLVKAIQDSKEYFISTKGYKDFEKTINQEYIASDNKYYQKENYKASLFKIIETIRHQVNHSLRDDEDNNILFAAYIDFEILEKLRIIINDIFNEVYKNIDKEKIKKLVLNKPKIKYSMDKLSNKVDELKLRIPESENRLNVVFKKENERALDLCEQLFNNSNLYDLLMKKPEAIRRFDFADKEMQKSFKRTEDYVNKNGIEFERKAIEIFKEFMKEKENETIKDTTKNIEELKTRLEKLSEKM